MSGNGDEELRQIYSQDEGSGTLPVYRLLLVLCEHCTDELEEKKKIRISFKPLGPIDQNRR